MTDSYFFAAPGFGGGLGTLRVVSLGLPAAILLILWLVLAGAIAIRETSVDKPNRVAQLYGYTICLISLILALVSFSGLLDAAFERGNPLQGGDFPFGGSLTSFEAYKARGAKATPFDRDASAAPDTASETSLRARYDALVAERFENVRYRTSKDLVTKGLMLAISLALFGFHWRWVRRLNGHPTAAAG